MIGLYDIKDGEDFVHAWNYIQIGKWNNHRLYFKQNVSLEKEAYPNKNGFRFCFLSFVEGPAHHSNDLWTHQTQVDISAKGAGYWDGCRHIWIKPENEQFDSGYLYYHNPLMWAEFFMQIRKLEEVYCYENEGEIY